MRIVKLVAADVARLWAVMSVVFCTWIAAWYLLDFIHWGAITGATVATVAATLNGLTMAYNVSSLDTPD